MPHNRANRISIRVLTGTILCEPLRSGPMGRLGALLAVPTALVLLAGCAGGSDLERTAPDLAALDEAGVVVEPGAPAAVWFTTPWCRGCDTRLADALRVADAHCDVRTTVVVGRAGEGAIGQYLDSADTTVCGGPPTVVVDRTGRAFGAVPVITAPTWLFVDDQGAVSVARDDLDDDALANRLADLAR